VKYIYDILLNYNERLYEFYEWEDNDYFDYVKKIEELIEKYATEDDNSVKYIDQLKPSVYKSLQMLWIDLNRGQHIYLDDNPSEELLNKREEIRNKVSNLFSVTLAVFSNEYLLMQ
jgi:hypothetical protein